MAKITSERDMYDVVIVGSGLGGLCCGVILAKEGLRVLILEKNKQIGGCLQTYVRDKVIFDSGVHYIGGLSPGQNLHSLFSYLGIMHQLKLEALNKTAFDTVIFQDGGEKFELAQGMEEFKDKLISYFPTEERAIQKYTDDIRSVCEKFHLFNLRNGDPNEKFEVMSLGLNEYLDQITSNDKLKAVLTGNSILYAGNPDTTPFYQHALIIYSFIQSAWKCVNGGSQIARTLYRELKKYGGNIIRNQEVAEFVEVNGNIAYVKCSDESTYGAKYFISNLHPSITMALVNGTRIKPAYKNRLKELANTISTFYVNVVLHPKTVDYIHSNYYILDEGKAWQGINYSKENWPGEMALFFNRDEKNPEYCSGITIMCYMHFKELEQWENTHNTVSKKNERGSDYELFKIEKWKVLLSRLEKHFANLPEHIKSVHIATPLSFRDYIGTTDGSLYGFNKDHRTSMQSMIPARTKIPNLFLTGQNLNLHGILGVSLSSILTCSELFDLDYLLAKIKNA